MAVFSSVFGSWITLVFLPIAVYATFESTPVKIGERMKRKAVAQEDSLWSDKQVIYTFQDVIGEQAVYTRAVQEAIDHWENTTCIRFTYKDKQDIADSNIDKRQRYVLFQQGNGCTSSVGMTKANGLQTISLARSCAYTSLVIHELGHLLGLFHEQNRWDRDSHVLILWNNIKQGAKHNFMIRKNMKLLTPYDYSSMMHYEQKMFSEGGEHTIEPFDEKLAFLIGNRVDLSYYDKSTVNRMYHCQEQCDSDLSCDNEGYVTSQCRCACPHGLKGDHCQEVETDPECGGVVTVEGELDIFSPNYPKNYPNSVNCTWLLKGGGGRRLQLHIVDMDIEKTKKGTCRDLLEIRYAGLGLHTGPVVCGEGENQIVNSTVSAAIVNFQSNRAVKRRGFHIHVQTISKPDCNETVCHNGGQCEILESTDTEYCSCMDGWVGPTCEVSITDGGFSQWSNWTACVAKCGLQTRDRSCTDPEPLNGGEPCFGDTYETRECGDADTCNDSLQCNFGTYPDVNKCNLDSEMTVDMEWIIHQGSTQSGGTGPSAGHTNGGPNDAYLYLEASYGTVYQKAVAWVLQTDWDVGTYCLQFYYHMSGRGMGTLAIGRRLNLGAHGVVWQRSGHQGDGWSQASVNVLLYRGVQIGLVGVRGSGYTSDMAIDDFSVSPGYCAQINQTSTSGCLSGVETQKQGPFSYFNGCTRYNCFCNEDSKVDCPPWMQESIGCDQKNKKHQPKRRVNTARRLIKTDET